MSPARSMPDRLTPRERVYLGVDPNDSHKRVWSAHTDSVCAVGPPGYGRTSGVVVPTLLHWSGPVVSVATGGEALRFCGAHRARIAGPEGGVHVYDPFGAEAFGTLRWSPLSGCQDPTECHRRVRTLTTAVHGTADGGRRRTDAAQLLRPLFHAAALAGEDLAQVRRWLAAQDCGLPTRILRNSSSAREWADDLAAVDGLGELERGACYAAARTCLDGVADPRVLDVCSATDLDVDELLATRSTLFVVSPGGHPEETALVVALVDTIVRRAEQIAVRQGGRLRAPLLLALDDVADSVPLPDLGGLLGGGAERGLVTLWGARSLAQMRTRYGSEEQAALLTATNAKLVFGGMSNDFDLRNISSWSGEFREMQITTYGGVTGSFAPRRPGSAAQAGADDDGVTAYALSPVYRPMLPVEAIQQLPPRNAWLWWHSDPPIHVETPPAESVEDYRALSGHHPRTPRGRSA
ncbi:type IV secretory system conjugative DNA transfer family protein [Nocardiopsis sp. HNM0947]|uniref:Type IV secretory system conjugative DNA transfer family protein n=1 Tax=Nocardiopsis coralli TaxID=2772213 RepID=A0ABR9PE69_9ACTN|nr:type IV secretory system conjugative DNA transfer family protein [Nocardiopsis coralli]MBE3002123.1 type IV secretory system conjugative DNA transfer family protein [Nocardiopsis coralli]